MKIKTSINLREDSDKFLSFDVKEQYLLEEHEKELMPYKKAIDETMQNYCIRKSDLIDGFLFSRLNTITLRTMRQKIDAELSKRASDFDKKRYDEKTGFLRGD